MKFENTKGSKNFEDRTGGHQNFIRGIKDLQTMLFLKVLEQQRREGQIGPNDWLVNPAPPRYPIDPRQPRAPYL